MRRPACSAYVGAELRRIKAVRIGIIVRSDEFDRDAPAFDWTLFECTAQEAVDYTCPAALTGTLPANYRYRVYETIVPLAQPDVEPLTMTSRPHALPYRRRQSGVVLFIALIVMVALSIAGIALIRSVDTGLSVTANLGFRQASIPPSTWAVENAISAMFEKKEIDLEKPKPTTTTTRTARDQDAGQARGQLRRAVRPAGPHADNYPGTFVTETDGAGNTIRYVIERMCLDEGPAVAAICDMSPPKKSEATTKMEFSKPDVIRVPFYRVTVRVDGPNNTTTFAQATLR